MIHATDLTDSQVNQKSYLQTTHVCQKLTLIKLQSVFLFNCIQMLAQEIKASCRFFAAYSFCIKHEEYIGRLFSGFDPGFKQM